MDVQDEFDDLVRAIQEQRLFFEQLLHLLPISLSEIAAFECSGLLSRWRRLGSARRREYWRRAYEAKFPTRPAPRLIARPPIWILLFFRQDEVAGGMLVLQWLLRFRRGLAGIERLQEQWGQSGYLRRMLSIIKAKEYRRSRGLNQTTQLLLKLHKPLP